jgi:3-deoxy-7-phosphoheptulonate synthase
MSFRYIQQLPTPEEIAGEIPVPDGLKALKKERDAAISDVITGKSDKFLVIIGPCSADNEEAVCDYVSRLARVNEKVSDRLILIPRIYTNKPRTTPAKAIRVSQRSLIRKENRISRQASRR